MSLTFAKRKSMNGVTYFEANSSDYKYHVVEQKQCNGQCVTWSQLRIYSNSTQTLYSTSRHWDSIDALEVAQTFAKYND